MVYQIVSGTSFTSSFDLSDRIYVLRMKDLAAALDGRLWLFMGWGMSLLRVGSGGQEISDRINSHMSWIGWWECIPHVEYDLFYWKWKGLDAIEEHQRLTD